MLDGGVSRFPTLTIAGVDCVVEMFELLYVMNFCEIEGGGGSSKFGRFDAADLRAVRLWLAPAGSIVEAIEGWWRTAAAARLKS